MEETFRSLILEVINNIMSIDSKFCPACTRTLSKEEFYRDNRKADSLSTYCKDCQKLKSKKYYEENKLAVIKRVLSHRKPKTQEVSIDLIGNN